jgi:hypothetical protein
MGITEALQSCSQPMSNEELLWLGQTIDW